MYKNLLCLASIVLVFSLSAAVSYGQEVYEFDGGGDGTSWSDPINWEVVTNPDGTPGSGNPATAPAATTLANVPQLGVVITPGSTAALATIGTAAGAGSVSLGAGASLTTVGDVRLGNGNAGLLTMTGGTLLPSGGGADLEIGNNGSPGTMIMSDGVVTTADDLNIRVGSSLTMTGGTINNGDKMSLSDGGTLFLDGGDIISDDDIQIFQDSQATVDSGLWTSVDKLNFDQDPNANGKLTINGGIVRTEDFNLGITDILTDFRGVVEINGDGVYQVASEEFDESTGAPQPSNTGLANLSVRTARDLIAQGVHFITSELSPKKLGAFTITLAPGEFYGNTDPMPFTQISVVPEPTSALLLGLGSLGLLLRRKRAPKVGT